MATLRSVFIPREAHSARLLTLYRFQRHYCHIQLVQRCFMSNESTPPKINIMVVGGSGYVGGHVCEEAVRRGYAVWSVNRHGPPAGRENEEWVGKVNWIRASVFELEKWRKAVKLRDMRAVIACIGGFGSNEFMEKINGDANIVALREAKAYGVPKFVFISAHRYVHLPAFVLNSGYYHGKKRVEELIAELYPPPSGAILRPTFIYGTRRVANGKIPVPLWLVGRPLAQLLTISGPMGGMFQKAAQLPVGELIFCPPISVEEVARTAVRAAVEENIGGIIEVDEIARLAK